MRQIPVYSVERDAGLADLIRANASLAFTAKLSPGPERELTSRAKAQLVTAGAKDFDLYYLESIIATAGVWNLNDDVLDPYEVWAARHTPEDKPINVEHDCEAVVGHLLSSYAVDDDRKVIADDSPIDDLPAKFHLVTPSVLYRYWAKEDLQERMDALIASIEKGEKSVSMEALFFDFDYALASEDGTQRLVKRTKDTAFLTKHLRVYKGTGSYQGERVGRVPRRFVFSGKGVVDNPANPESAILSHASSIFYFPSETSVYSQVEERSHEPENTMAETKNDATDELKAEVRRLEAALKDRDAKASEELVTKLEKAEAAVADLTKKNETLEGELATANQTIEDAQSKLTATEEAKESLRLEVEKLRASELERTRVELVMDSLSMDRAKASELVDDLDGLSDEKFASHVARLKAAVPAETEAAKTESEPNPDPDGEGEPDPNADPDNLDNVELDSASAAALSAEEPPTAVTDIQKSVAKFLGYEGEDE